MLSIGVAIYLVNVRVTREAEQTLQREMVATSALVDQLRTTRTETFTQMARFIADAPKVKAAVDTNDPPTVQDIASGYQDQLKSNLLLVTNRSGAVLATVGATPQAALVVASQPAVRDALAGRESFSLLPQPDGMLQLVTVPILDRSGAAGDPRHGERRVSARQRAGRAVEGDHRQRCRVRDGRAGSGGHAAARDVRPRSAGQLRTSGISQLSLAGEDYLVLPRPLCAAGAATCRRDPVRWR